MRTILLGLAVLAMTVTAANASTYVWWTLESANTPAVATESGLGHQLVIEKPLSAGPDGYYEFTLKMWIDNDAATSTQGCKQHRTSLYKNATENATWQRPADGTGDGTIGNLDPLGWETAYSGTTYINQGQRIFANYGRATSSTSKMLWNDNSPLAFIIFVLRIPEAEEQFSQWHYFYQVVGAQSFSLTPATTAGRAVYFGSNTAVGGNLTNQDTWAVAQTKTPVIAIHATPEPATLALLGLGLLGLIRRR